MFEFLSACGLQLINLGEIHVSSNKDTDSFALILCERRRNVARLTHGFLNDLIHSVFTVLVVVDAAVVFRLLGHRKVKTVLNQSK